MQVLEFVRFIDKQGIHTQIGKIHRTVFLPRCRQQSLIAVFHFLTLFFQLLDGSSPSFVGLGIFNSSNNSVNLFLEYFLLHFTGHIHLLERGMRHNHRVPIACGNLAEQALPVLFCKIILFRHQNIRIRVELVKFILPLIQQMVGHNHHRL